MQQCKWAVGDKNYAKLMVISPLQRTCCHNIFRSELFGGTNLMHGSLRKDDDVLGDGEMARACIGLNAASFIVSLSAAKSVFVEH